MAMMFGQNVAAGKARVKGFVVGSKKNRIMVKHGDGSIKAWKVEALQVR